jgi:phosphopantothenoylcysteine decarboxylase/phosphopantothenate--cysteine ligase
MSFTPSSASDDEPSQLPAANRQALCGRRVILCVTGSIAAYKACELTRLLVKQGANVRIVMTKAATEFVGKATFSAITQQPVLTEMFGGNDVGESHVTLSAAADLVLVAPATADVLARLAQGRADDLVTATALCSRCPLLIAPAMHPGMWSHPATQRNVQQLRDDGRAIFVGPVEGAVASGDVGFGRFADPVNIFDAVVAALTPQDLAGRHVVVTAGPTVEDLDPVRFLSNRSSGKMGYAIAREASLRGAKVTLVSGPVSLPCPTGVTRIEVRSALEMKGVLWAVLGEGFKQADALIMAAAVGDFRFSTIYSQKLKRDTPIALPPLEGNPDILAEIGAARKHTRPLLVGFALETDADHLVELAQKKLDAKHVDAVVANLAGESLGLDENTVTIVSATASERLAALPKAEVAARVLDWTAKSLGALC